MTAAAGERAYHRPETVAEACRNLADAEGQTMVVAGGQTVMLMLREGIVDPDALVDVSAIPALGGVSVDDGTATFGATTTYADLAAHDLSERVTMFEDACAVVGDRQIRNAGTLAGAVCYGVAALDILSVLLCLDATLAIESADGHRTQALDDFLRGDGETDLGRAELVTGIDVTLPPSDAGSAYIKHSSVEAGWPTVGVAATVTVDDGEFTDVSVGLTAVADRPIRAPSVEDALDGAAVSEDALATAAGAASEDIDPSDDRGGSARYKRALTPTLVERTLETATRRAGGAL
ncbi:MULTISPECIES: FAD binding domain-containing protein [Salinibaculum]|uniref:FAD binding domain-containing protein n=1 Tax=Salinibaculum TaxID=2732368 RepID=UPI0030D11D75